MTGFQPGSLVLARGREWVVLPESDTELLVLRPLGGTDDETTGVLPALEQVESAQFPWPDATDAGNASRAGLLRTALRTGFRSSGGPFRSLAGLAVEPRAYQIVPLLMALRQRRVRLLIGDDVGIGKTIEAALIAAELLAQGDTTGLAVLCSPALARQWQTELATKFGIHAEVLLPGTVHRLQRNLTNSQTVFDRYPHLVISTDFIKRPGLREQLYRGCPDLVIVDEAHTCVADDTTRRGGARMQRYELLRELARDTRRHLVLVTATPHSGKDETFRNLIGLLDPALADSDLESDTGRDLLARHFVQRRRADIRRYLDETTPFPEDRQTAERPYRLDTDYRDLFVDVIRYAKESVRGGEAGSVRQRVRYWSALALLRALASSPRAAAESLRTRAATVEALDTDDADAHGRATVMDQSDDEAIESVDVTPGADDTSEAGPEKRRLLEFARRADAITDKSDAKLRLLLKEVKALLADGFNPVVFCRFIDTAEYVADFLSAKLTRVAAVEAVTGKLPHEERAARIDSLAADGRRPVLVATDCLSEGVNLQEHFQAVIHYDLAWNPTRHEQREGRVDRFGQRSPKVRALTIYGVDNQIDPVVLRVLLRKHEEIRRALGVAVPVPDRSDDVLQAIMHSVLLSADDPQQLTLDLFAEQTGGALHRDWESSAEREKQSRTRYAQRAIQPEVVAREVAATRASLGSPADIAHFMWETLDALGGGPQRTSDESFTANMGSLPVGLRDAFPAGHPASVEFHRDLPATAGAAHLGRTDPYVVATARFVLESALDAKAPAATRPSRRCGVMRTTTVTIRTTLLLLRYRLHLTLPGHGEPRPVVAEEATLVAYHGPVSNPTWLSDDAVAALLQATPSGNIAPDQAAVFLERAIIGLADLTGHLDTYGDHLAERLRTSHLRVRESVGQHVRRQITVAAQRPADVLAVYVYLPEAAT